MRTLLIASLLTLGALTISLPTQATTQFTGQYWIINKHSGRALDVAEFSDYFDRVQADANERGVYLEGDDD